MVPMLSMVLVWEVPKWLKATVTTSYLTKATFSSY